ATAAWSIGLGAPKTTGGYPALFAAATIGGTTGYFRTDDAGVNWVQINDATHGFGAISANVVSGDSRTYGRVYIGTNGRGIFYGDASGTQPSNTATATTIMPTSTTSAVTSTTKATTTSTTKPVTTSTTKPVTTSTTKATTTTSSTAPTATAGPYGQCGGQGWTGPTVCATGWTCVASNTYYSQCLQP
ncbi:hypothetical protein FRC12_023474, partial [Ceratobasidium sp. 428]